ncbi:MAG: UMP kinase [Lachnospiraceae bacterium]|jgi:uridylate kinase|nr:UMP kinase [Lachnospiraceae bacterium]MEE3461839.1 UMP kinase [Lachnospiraceae bacterium]
MAYKRIMLKLSGEALAGDKKTGFDENTCLDIAEQVKRLVESDVQVAVVTGGGNFWRGRTSENIERTKADQIGMLATVMNCIYVSEIFRSTGLETVVMTPFQCGAFTELFNKDRAMKYLKKGKVVFCAGGTGHPYFSTDTAVVLRAIELEADIILSGKSIDGVYDSDPAVNPDAKKYDKISIDEVINKRLGVIDLASSVLLSENHMPMMIFGLNKENAILETAMGMSVGTLIEA